MVRDTLWADAIMMTGGCSNGARPWREEIDCIFVGSGIHGGED